MNHPKKKNVHGEGNYEAARRYRKRQKDYQENANVEEAARKARKAIEGEEREELERAEKEGKRRAKI